MPTTGHHLQQVKARDVQNSLLFLPQHITLFIPDRRGLLEELDKWVSTRFCARPAVSMVIRTRCL